MRRLGAVVGALVLALVCLVWAPAASWAATPGWHDTGTSYFATGSVAQGQTVPVPVSTVHDVEVVANGFPGGGVVTVCTAAYTATGGCAPGSAAALVCPATTCDYSLWDYGTFDAAGNDLGAPTSTWQPYLADPALYLTGGVAPPAPTPSLADQLGSGLLSIAAAVGAMVLAGALVAFSIYALPPMLRTARTLLLRMGVR